MKIAILLIIALAVIVWLQRLKKNLVNKVNEAARQAEQFQRDAANAANGDANAHNGAHPSVSGVTPRVEVMVACAHCGLHFPASEAVTDHAGTVFCGEEHLRLHAVHVS